MKRKVSGQAGVADVVVMEMHGVMRRQGRITLGARRTVRSSLGSGDYSIARRAALAIDQAAACRFDREVERTSQLRSHAKLEPSDLSVKQPSGLNRASTDSTSAAAMTSRGPKSEHRGLGKGASDWSGKHGEAQNRAERPREKPVRHALRVGYEPTRGETTLAAANQFTIPHSRGHAPHFIDRQTQAALRILVPPREQPCKPARGTSAKSRDLA